jgi:hypothetical protein
MTETLLLIMVVDNEVTGMVVIVAEMVEVVVP